MKITHRSSKAQLTLNTAGLRALAPDGAILTSVSTDDTVKLWDLGPR
jgi:hypothetical protein